MRLTAYPTLKNKDNLQRLGKLVVYAEHDGEAEIIANVFNYLQSEDKLKELVDFFRNHDKIKDGL